MNYHKKVLPNGMRIITVPLKDSPAVTVLVMVEAGSKYEEKRNNGISHFLEHMVFKGTPRRPKASEISKELDGIGAQYNAFTGQEYTGYYAKAHKSKFADILDVVADMYQNPLFEEKEIAKERGVIVEEINMYEDMPHRHVHDLFMELLYGDQPAGWNIAGPREVVKGMTRKDFVEYRAKHYLAGSTIVIVSGNIDEKQTVSHIEKAFAGVSAGTKEGKLKVVEGQKAPEVLVKYKETDQTHLVLGVRAYHVLDKRIPALAVLNGVLGSGMSSRLFQKLRDEMGVGYYVRSGTDEFTDHGILAVSTGVDTTRVKEVISAILGEFKKLRDVAVPEEELIKAKEHLIGNLYLSLEGSDDLANFYGGQEVLGKPLQTPDEVVAEIRKVTAAEIQKVAQDIFKEEKLNLALIGKFKEKGEFEALLKF